MQVLLAVIDDLFRFAKESLFGGISVLRTHSVSPAVVTQESYVLPGTEKSSHSLLLDDAATFGIAQGVFENGRQYYVGEQNSFVFTDPVISFDTAYKKLQYGSTVELVKFGGRWAQVRMGVVHGWILKDVLQDRISDIQPNLVSGNVYTAENLETEKLRAVIDDMFFCGHAELPLTSAEYVSFMLHQHRRSIPWPETRPRTMGTWQNILRGRSGVHMGITPKTQSVMEYVIDDLGYVVFVEAVFPDESIKISGVGLMQEGQYTESVISKEEWRELRPVFIEVA